MKHKCPECDRYIEPEEESFEEYVDEEVLSMGSYTYQDKYSPDLRAAEFEDGSGFILPDDLKRAIEDENVTVGGIENGWLRLADER